MTAGDIEPLLRTRQRHIEQALIFLALGLAASRARVDKRWRIFLHARRPKHDAFILADGVKLGIVMPGRRAAGVGDD